MTNQEGERLVREAVAALQAGRADEARRALAPVIESGRANVQIWLLLAMACQTAGDAAGEEAALDGALRLDPRTLRAHIMKADLRSKAGDDRLAAEFYKSAIQLAAGQRLPNDLAQEMGRVEAALEALTNRLTAEREAALAAQGLAPHQRSPRLQHALELSDGRRQIYFQEPTSFYLPELPQIQYYDPATFDWAPAVEAAWRDIRAEIEPVLTAGADGFAPYIQFDPDKPRLDDNPLVDRQEWSTLYLCNEGVEQADAIARFPKTWAAVQGAPLHRAPNSAPTVMFSLLRPGARIIPHTGVHNARLTCHLPLIVPPGCGFRVGNETRQWEEGKLLIFDDSIEHEAWNESDRDRLILIFDIWRPELNEQERRELAILFGGLNGQQAAA